MSQKWHRVQRDRFKGRRFERAGSTGVEMFSRISADFMQRIFELHTEEYLITDESSLADFTELDASLEEVQKRVAEVYEIDLAGIPAGNLLEIFKRIDRKYR